MKSLKVTDKELVKRALEGESEAFAELVGRYRDAAYAIALHVLGEPGEAAQAAQDAFIRAYQNLAQLKNPARFAPWLCRIAQNRARSYLAAKHAAPQLASLEDVEDKAAGQPSPREEAEKSEVTNLIRRLMQRLPDEQRLTFTLFYINGYSERDVSGMLSVPVGTVKSRLSHARRRLKKEVVKMADDVLKGSRPDAEFWRSATGAMAGRVTSAATGEPIKGVKLLLFERCTHNLSSVLSKADGTWEAQGILPGAYSIDTIHPDFVYQTFRGKYGSFRTAVVVRPGQTVRGVDFRLEPGARIRGIVLSPDGTPVAEAPVDVWRETEPSGPVCFGKPRWVQAKTDSQGRFSIGPLAEGKCRVGAQTGKKMVRFWDLPVCYYPGTFSFHDAEWVAASAGKEPKALTLRLAQKGTARLSVHVAEAETGKPLSRAYVLVNRRDVDWDVFHGFTDEEGLFQTDLLTRGLYQITVDAHDKGFPRWSRWIDVGPGDSHFEIKFDLPKGAIFEGKMVTEDGSELPSQRNLDCWFWPNRPKEMEGRPLRTTDAGSGSSSGFHLSHSEGPPPEQARADEHGGFASPPIWPGRVRLSANFCDKDWRVGSISVGGKPVFWYECKPGERVRDVKIVLVTNLGVVAGRVISAEEKTPVDGVWVHLWRIGAANSGLFPTETDATGSFFFHSVPAGRCVLAISRSRDERPIESTKREIAVEPGGVVHLDLALCG